jgi:hypothetical protein
VPSALTALPAQVSRLHFLTKLILAAPWSGLPLAPTALLSQDCAAAVPTAKQVINAATTRRLIGSSFKLKRDASQATGRSDRTSAQLRRFVLAAGYRCSTADPMLIDDQRLIDVRRCVAFPPRCGYQSRCADLLLSVARTRSVCLR